MKTSEGGANGNLLNRNTLNGNAALFITVMGVRRGGKCLYLPTKKKKERSTVITVQFAKTPPLFDLFFVLFSLQVGTSNNHYCVRC